MNLGGLGKADPDAGAERDGRLEGEQGSYLAGDVLGVDAKFSGSAPEGSRLMVVDYSVAKRCCDQFIEIPAMYLGDLITREVKVDGKFLKLSTFGRGENEIRDGPVEKVHVDESRAVLSVMMCPIGEPGQIGHFVFDFLAHVTAHRPRQEAAG